MNTFLTDPRVTLNRVIRRMRRNSFRVSRNRNYALCALPTDLTAAVSTEIVSGEIRYQITTAKRDRLDNDPRFRSQSGGIDPS